MYLLFAWPASVGSDLGSEVVPGRKPPVLAVLPDKHHKKPLGARKAGSGWRQRYGW